MSEVICGCTSVPIASQEEKQSLTLRIQEVEVVLTQTGLLKTGTRGPSNGRQMNDDKGDVVRTFKNPGLQSTSYLMNDALS